MYADAVAIEQIMADNVSAALCAFNSGEICFLPEFQRLLTSITHSCAGYIVTQFFVCAGTAGPFVVPTTGSGSVAAASDITVPVPVSNAPLPSPPDARQPDVAWQRGPCPISMGISTVIQVMATDYMAEVAEATLVLRLI